MITSHGYQGMSDDPKLDSDLKIVRDIMTDPFASEVGPGGVTPPPGTGGQGSAHFGSDDDFDLNSMQMPCMTDEMQGYQQSPYTHMMHHQQQPHQQGMYHQHHHQQMNMQQHQQQQHWAQHQYMNGGYYDQYNNYGYNQSMYQHPQMQHQQQQQQQVGMVTGGGPSPVGSHNTPSPQALSESDVDEHTIRNNNILKRPSPNGDSFQQQQQHLMQQQVGMPHHGHMAASHHHHGHGHPHAHPHHHHPHVHPHHHMMASHPGAGLMPGGPPVPKKPKVSKRKKKRDPNEPQKPVSAYALFFRDSQASIKAANPNAAFGDVSKIVASMWDGLDPDSKAAYKKRTENAKKDYLKKLAAYRASLVSKGSGGPGDGNIGYGGTFAGFSTFGSESNLIHHGHHPVKPYMTTAAGNGNVPQVANASGSPVGGTGGYLSGQPVPPRPPVQSASQMSGLVGHPHHQAQIHHTGSSYMNMHGQAMQNGMLGSMHHANSHHHGHHPAHHPLSPLDHGVSQPPPTSGSAGSSHSPASTASTGSSSTQQNSSAAPPTSTTTPSTASPSSTPGGSSGVHKRCGRPGCSNPIQGWTSSEFCSNECVVGQCREVYSHWSSGANTAGQTNGQGQPQYPGPGAPTSNRTTTPVK